MKKEIEVKIAAKPARPAKPATKKTKVVIQCDFCSADLPDHGSYGHYWSCDLCGRDTCRKHQRIDDHGDDHPDWYCYICYELKFVKYREEAEANRWLYDSLVEKLTKSIKKESLATKAKKE